MTDARYPERWLNDRRLLRLSDGAHRLFVVALAWSVSNRTDGALQHDDLRLIPGIDTARTPELVSAGLWVAGAAGWTIAEFEHSQTTAAQLAGLERKRAVDRERQARHRARGTRSVTRDDPSDSTGEVAMDETYDTTRDTKARTGQATTGKDAEVHDLSARAQHKWAQGYDQ